MPVDPQSKAVLEMLAVQNARPLVEMTPAEVRAEREKNAAAMAALAGPLPAVARIQNRSIPGPAGPIPVRIYWPENQEKLAVLVYFHGGGWVFGNLDSVDRTCRALANTAGCVLVSVDYRLAPEHKFPAAVEDAYASVCYVAAHAAEFNADPNRIAVGGDSSGGNLAAVVCLVARDRGVPRIAFQLLVYPVTDYDDARASLNEYGEGYLLTREMMPYFWGHYVSGPEQARQPYASPINAKSLQGLPPAMLITAECDPIRDQAEAYAQRLREAGVPVIQKRYSGAIHAFFQMAGVIDAGKQAIADAASALRDAFSKAGAAV